MDEVGRPEVVHSLLRGCAVNGVFKSEVGRREGVYSLLRYCAISDV